ncbi:MAG: hypothetical protein HXO48_09580, partial [Prevotella sp.]|nr:hypothetical protein [Prevotella sp.]
MALVSCSNDIEQNTSGKVDIKKTATFRLNFANFNEEQEVKGTRASSTGIPDSIKLKPIELANGILACPTLVKDKQEERKPTTRSLGNENYTMLAYKGGVLVGEMSGTASDAGGTATFTPTSSNQNISLTPGTYDFVCYTTNYVTRSGDEITVERNYADKALIGRAAGVTVSGVKQEIPFSMKHVAARVRIKINAWKSFDASTADLRGIANDLPQKTVYNASTGVYGYTQGAVSGYYSLPASTTGLYPFQKSVSDYQYFMPGTDPSKLKIRIYGTFYKASMNDYFNVKPDAVFTFKENESYTLRFDLLYDYLYLFSDGTIGHFTETTQGGGTKTAIGIVVSRSKRLAMALNEVVKPNSGMLVDYSFWHPTPPANQDDINNTKWNLNSYGAPDWNSFTNDENGYAYTWLGSGSSDGTTIKATAKDPGTGKPVFPAFYYAAHYDEELTAQGITLAPNVGAGKWFLPTFAQFYKAYVNLGFADNLPIGGPTYGTPGYEGTINNYD